jgi:hypothetical protein
LTQILDDSRLFTVGGFPGPFNAKIFTKGGSWNDVASSPENTLARDEADASKVSNEDSMSEQNELALLNSLTQFV